MAQTSVKQTTISIRVDEDVKRDIDFLLDKLGMNISVLVNMLFKQMIMDEALPFQPRYRPKQTRETILAKGMEAMREAQEQAILNGTSELSLDDINEIIKECRKENRRA